MKRLSLLVLATVVLVASLVPAATASSAQSASPSATRTVATAERSLNIVLDGSSGNDRITIALSVDGRSYEIESAQPLEVGGTVCTHPEKDPDALLCEATPIAGFEINTGAGNDAVILGKNVPVPATIRGGEGDDVLVGGAGADKLIGGPGDDELNGRGGNDLLLGGAGDDTLIGGAGDDRLVGGPGRNIELGGPGKNVVE
ncbi:MAG: calcium-binding protein [Solirubrobacterales bacterium]